MEAKRALEALDFGSVSSESEDDLDRLFVRTSDFDKFLKPNVWLALGAKGTGKSAIFELFTKYQPAARKLSGGALDDVIIAAGTGFGDLTEIATGDLQSIKLKAEGYDHDRLWRLYIAIKSGMALDSSFQIPRGPLKELMVAIGGRRDYRIGSLLRDLWELAVSSPPKSVTVSAGGASVTLCGDGRTLDVVTLLEDVNTSLNSNGKVLWLLFDKIDEIWPSDRSERKKALEGLVTACMYIRRTFPAIQPVLMLRTDLWADLDFTNKDHLTDKRIELNWNSNQLVSLLVKRALRNEPVCRYLTDELSKLSGSDVDSWSPEDRLSILEKIFPSTAYPGEKEAAIMDWLMQRITDGRGTALPRDAIVMANQAAQLERDGGSVWSHSLLSRESVRKAFTKTSEIRCESFLAEFPELRGHFRKFNGQTKSSFTKKEILQLMSGLAPNGDELLERLFDIGVIRPDSGRVLTAKSFEIPRLYRAGLGLVIRGRP